MAYLQARSGIARSGVTYAGWVPPTLRVYIGGTDRTSSIDYENFVITDHVGVAAGTFAFVADSFTPTLGHDVYVTYSTPNERLFGGTLLQMEAVPAGSDTGSLRWRCVAISYGWLLNRYDLVLASYASTGVGTMVADILARFTDGGFRVGYIPESLGNLTMTFTHEQVTGAISRIAQAVDASYEITPDRIINIYDTYPEAALPTAVGSNITLEHVTYNEDLTQVRTRVIFEGQGTTTTAAVSPGATTIPVEDTSIFLEGGGIARAGMNVILYAGRSTAGGPGNLTGVTGVIRDIQQGDSIVVRVDLSDTAAIAALAAVLGAAPSTSYPMAIPMIRPISRHALRWWGPMSPQILAGAGGSGLSGRITHYIQDGRVGVDEATQRALIDLADFGGALKEMDFHYVTPPKDVRAGRTVSVSVTTPMAISGTFQIQTVETRPRLDISGQTIDLWRGITASPLFRRFTDLLKRVES